MFGASPLASIVRLEDGEVTYTVGGSIFARANDTSLQSLADLAGRRVMTLSKLTVSMQAASWQKSSNTMLHLAGGVCSDRRQVFCFTLAFV